MTDHTVSIDGLLVAQLGACGDGPITNVEVFVRPCGEIRLVLIGGPHFAGDKTPDTRQRVELNLVESRDVASLVLNRTKLRP